MFRIETEITGQCSLCSRQIDPTKEPYFPSIGLSESRRGRQEDWLTFHYRCWKRVVRKVEAILAELDREKKAVQS